MQLTLDELELINIRRDYRILRKQYFPKDHLPPVERVAILFAGIDALGASIDDVLRFQLGVIIIQKGIGSTRTRWTLLHEMAHLAVNIRHKRSMGHGRLWQREMMRLARLGAFDNYW